MTNTHPINGWMFPSYDDDDLEEFDPVAIADELSRLELGPNADEDELADLFDVLYDLPESALLARYNEALESTYA